jgi:hypothetical protein
MNERAGEPRHGDERTGDTELTRESDAVSDAEAASDAAVTRDAATQHDRAAVPGADATIDAKIELTSSAQPARRRTGNARSAIAAWLVAPTLLAATATGILFVMRGPDRFFAYAVSTLFALAVAWVLISVFFPAAPERTCPRCGGGTLQRLDASTLRGVACSACGFADPEQSSFLMAEEEGSIEFLVLSERALSRSGGTREKTERAGS